MATKPEFEKAPSLGVNAFYRRHTPESRYSHFAGNEEELLGLVEQNFVLGRKGNREGSWIVPLPVKDGDHNNRFFSAVIRIRPHMFFETECVNKDGYLLVMPMAVAKKSQGAYAEVILWSSDLLKKAGEATTNKDFEIISLRVADVEQQPDHPYAIAQAILENKDCKYTLEEVARSITYWGERVLTKQTSTHFIDKKLGELVNHGDLDGAMERRKTLCPNETPDDSAHYVKSIQIHLRQAYR